MTVTATTLVDSKYVENVQTTQYTSTNLTTIIDKCTVSNNTASAVTLTINLVNNGGTAGADNIFVPTITVQPNSYYLCPEIVGQTLKNGQFLSTLAGSASALTIRISGRQIS